MFRAALAIADNPTKKWLRATRHRFVNQWRAQDERDGYSWPPASSFLEWVAATKSIKKAGKRE
jgi:hypothetical protein